MERAVKTFEHMYPAHQDCYRFFGVPGMKLWQWGNYIEEIERMNPLISDGLPITTNKTI